jgi:hypothetical protein
VYVCRRLGEGSTVDKSSIDKCPLNFRWTLKLLTYTVLGDVFTGRLLYNVARHILTFSWEYLETERTEEVGYTLKFDNDRLSDMPLMYFTQA